MDITLPPAGTDVCAIGDIAVDFAIVVALGRGSGGLEIIVVRDAAGVRGFVNVCPHNPLPLNIDSRIYSHDQHVHCDHHFAKFRFSDGMCTAGACIGEGLAPVALHVEGTRVTVA
jgi:nitrite reductase/ring-hydroxylating ferredoxin subunit